MDPYAPINGISLERYAELSAEVAHTQDPEQQAQVVGQLGVARADWDAAKNGWTARMQDMSLMGAVATRYMPLYQAALAKKSPAPQISFEEYVAMGGAAAALGYQAMLAHYGVSQAQWTQIAGHWTSTIPTRPEYMQYGLLVEQEAARIRSGGACRPVSIGGGGSVAPPAAAPQPGMPQPGMPQPGMPQPGAPQGQPQAWGAPQGQPQAWGAPQGQPQAWGAPQGQQAFNQQAAQFGNEVGNAFNAFGSALGSFVDGAVGGITVGSRVMVQWSDGNRYGATVCAAQGSQVEVSFPDGRRVWMPSQFVTLA
jgi:hypothetical protein